MRSYARPFIERKKGFFRALTLCVPMLFLLSVFTQAVFATTYVINDGPRVFSYTGFAADPGVVIDGAGLRLREADSYTTEPLGGGGAITICRGQLITVRYHGQSMEVSSAGETVGALLDRMGLEVDPEDRVTPERTAETYSGMLVSVDQVVTQRQTYTTQIPHDTIRCTSMTLPEGVEERVKAGSDGELLRTADVTYINGVETQREILSEKQLSPPVTEIMAYGTGEPIPRRDPGGLPVIDENTITLPTGEVLTYTDTAIIRATAYTHTDDGCNMTTATGSTVRRGTVAVDPRYIPYGTRMFIMAVDGSYVYGVAEAEDCGGDIKGDRMDLYMPTFEACMDFGRRTCVIYFLG